MHRSPSLVYRSYSSWDASNRVCADVQPLNNTEKHWFGYSFINSTIQLLNSSASVSSTCLPGLFFCPSVYVVCVYLLVLLLLPTRCWQGWSSYMMLHRSQCRIAPTGMHPSRLRIRSRRLLPSSWHLSTETWLLVQLFNTISRSFCVPGAGSSSYSIHVTCVVATVLLLHQLLIVSPEFIYIHIRMIECLCPPTSLSCCASHPIASAPVYLSVLCCKLSQTRPSWRVSRSP